FHVYSGAHHLLCTFHIWCAAVACRRNSQPQSFHDHEPPYGDLLCSSCFLSARRRHCDGWLGEQQQVLSYGGLAKRSSSDQLRNSACIVYCHHLLIGWNT